MQSRLDSLTLVIADRVAAGEITSEEALNAANSIRKEADRVACSVTTNADTVIQVIGEDVLPSCSRASVVFKDLLAPYGDPKTQEDTVVFLEEVHDRLERALDEVTSERAEAARATHSIAKQIEVLNTRLEAPLDPKECAKFLREVLVKKDDSSNTGAPPPDLWKCDHDPAHVAQGDQVPKYTEENKCSGWKRVLPNGRSE